eukprot:g45178.t1
MEGLQVALSQLKVIAANLWVLWLIAWAPSAPVGVTMPEQDCITSFDLALKHWLDAKLDTEFALPTKDNFLTRTKVRLMRSASRLRYLQLHAPNVVKDMLAWDVQAFITREIAKRDSSQVEGMVEVKEAVGTSETGLGRPGIQTIYYQVLGQAPVKAASVDRFEASALLEALDRGSDGNLAEAASVVKSQMASVCKKNDAKGFGLVATNNCSQVKRTLSTAGLQFYHPATILFVDGTGLTALGVPMLRIDFFTMGVMVRSMRQHLVKSGLTQETLESILCQKDRVSLAGKLLEVLKEGKWEIKIVALRRIRRGEEVTFDYQKKLMNLCRKETILEAAVSATDSLKSVRLTTPSSSSASSSSRVGRQKTAPSSTSASSFSKVALQKKGTHF